MGKSKGRYRAIDLQTWRDKKVKKLSLEERCVFLYFITNEHSHLAGIYYLPRPLAALELIISENKLNDIMGVLIEKEMIAYDTEHHTIWVVNMLEYQALGGPKTWRAVHNQLEKVSDAEELVEKYRNHYHEYLEDYHNPLPGASKGYRKGTSIKDFLPVTDTDTVSDPVKEEGSEKKEQSCDSAQLPSDRRPDGYESTAITELCQDHANAGGYDIATHRPTQPLSVRMLQAIREFDLPDCRRAMRGHIEACKANDSMKPVLRLAFPERNGFKGYQLDQDKFQEYIQEGRKLDKAVTGGDTFGWMGQVHTRSNVEGFAKVSTPADLSAEHKGKRDLAALVSRAVKGRPKWNWPDKWKE